jgi:hypothetical protein
LIISSAISHCGASVPSAEKKILPKNYCMKQTACLLAMFLLVGLANAQPSPSSTNGKSTPRPSTDKEERTAPLNVLNPNHSVTTEHSLQDCFKWRKSPSSLLCDHEGGLRFH